MKTLASLGFALLAAGLLALSACYDPANQLSNKNSVGSLDREALRKKAVASLKNQKLENPGKLYIKDGLLYVNERQKGLHIFDNNNPAEPKKLDFISIPGNLDVAMKGDALFADSYMDLLVVNTKTKETTRIKDVFTYFPEAGNTDPQGRMLAQGAGNPMNPGFQAVSHGGEGGGSETGTAGSMSRFAVVGENLYVLDGNTMKIFNIKTPYAPEKMGEIKMDFAVETIFPYQDKLFIGGTQGMYVYDNTDPVKPKFLGKVEHIFACDPVVVEGNYAYVTLRAGAPCRGAENNELLIVDVTDPTKMKINHSFPLHNPHGLAIKNDILYVCDGNQGLKVFDTKDKAATLNNLLFKDPSLRKAYDVIALSDMPVVVVVGKDGIFQYDAQDPKNLVRLSQIPVEKAS